MMILMIDLCLYCGHHTDKHKFFVNINQYSITQGVFWYNEEDLGEDKFRSCGCHGGLEILEFELVKRKDDRT